MDLQFKRQAYPCLKTVVREIRNTELTQEIRLPDGMPDIGHILCAWGQTVLRGKEWRLDSVSFSAGMTVWVLYVPEDGAEAQCIETWIPFQMRWDLPDNCPEGTLRIRCLTRFVDARSVSPRKIMVRAGAAAQVEAYVPDALEVWEPGEAPAELELLKSRWPVRLVAEAGEKTFLLDEDLQLPEGARQLIRYRLDLKLTEQRVLGNKLVFRGIGNLHLVCRMENGQICGLDLELPFSQYAQLEGDYGQDARCDILPAPANLEVALEEESRIRFKGSIVAQYTLSDLRILTAVEDAYAPGRELRLHRDTVQLPAVLEQRREILRAEQSLCADAARLADVCVLPDYPRQRTEERGVLLEMPGQIQVLYYTADGSLGSASGRWEVRQLLPADEHTRIWAVPGAPEGIRGDCSGDSIGFTGEIPLELTSEAAQEIAMVTEAVPGDPQPKDPDRPSLILRRAGRDRLWDIAKSCGSTVEAICRINDIAGEPEPDRVLLIPVP